MIGDRLRSPLRWLSAVMGSLMTLALAGIVEVPALVLAIPLIACLFMLAPPLGVFRHAEAPVAHASLRLEAREVDETQPTHLTQTRFRLAVVNDSPAGAADFRIRLLIPHGIAPPDARVRPLGSLHVGAFGVHWNMDSLLDVTAITFRSAPRDSEDTITCPAGSRLELADLILPSQARPFDLVLDYQVSGGNVKAVLAGVRVSSNA
ncbi:MAG TPA: hypothetical protein VMM78_07920 [Thermomicrobiales bacterium]|nr:hypothetical protein [Thermomicrobiales bacterium]